MFFLTIFLLSSITMVLNLIKIQNVLNYLIFIIVMRKAEIWWVASTFFYMKYLFLCQHFKCFSSTTMWETINKFKPTYNEMTRLGWYNMVKLCKAAKKQCFFYLLWKQSNMGTFAWECKSSFKLGWECFKCSFFASGECNVIYEIFDQIQSTIWLLFIQESF